MRLIYLFMSKGPAPTGSIRNCDLNQPCSSGYTDNSTGLYTEGYFYLLKRMLDHGIIDDLLVFYESNRGYGRANWGHGIQGYVVPEIRFVDKFIKPGDIIYARGGFRTWFEWLKSKKKDGHWLINYSANTGRQKWTIWDIVFWDLNEIYDLDRHGRLWYYFVKPIHPMFKLDPNIEPIYDFCIGASHIHDKKGQWRTIEVLKEYQKMYHWRKPKCVLPGSIMRGTETRKIQENIKRYNLDVTLTGMLPRSKMCSEVYNKSKIFVHLGTHGQNDRGPLEAFACGNIIILGSSSYHSPILYKENRHICDVVEDLNNYKNIASLMFNERVLWSKELRNKSSLYFKKSCDIETRIIPDMKRLFGFIRENFKPSMEVKKELLRKIKDETTGGNIW